jgi:tetratricopeptide (TPR) repeat protein
MDKNKIIEAAAKLVAKGAYDKAIKEYQKVLDGDPRDVRVLQKMGELYQKKNDNIQAAYYFTKVAESDPSTTEDEPALRMPPPTFAATASAEPDSGSTLSMV